MHFAYLIVTIIVGTFLGSFLNVCILRIPQEESVAFPPSHCCSCGHNLGFWDLIPVLSYLFLGRKCRYCKAKISPQYMMVELLTGVLFGYTFFKFGFTIEFFAIAALIMILIVISFIDIEYQIIPNGLVGIGIGIGVILIIYNLFYPYSLYQDRNWYNPLIGGIVASGILFLVSLIGSLIYKTEDVMGMGDVKIFIPIGMILGWRLTFVSLFMAILLGGIFGIVSMLMNKKERKSLIPFGPFISLGTVISAFWGLNIISWYLGLLINT